MKTEKSCLMLGLTFTSWICVSLLSWKLFIVTVPDLYGTLLTVLLKLFYLPWMLFWLWGIHNFWHQAFSIFLRKRDYTVIPSSMVNTVVILYTTCDDFDEVACYSCLKQSYPKTHLIICDDSTDNTFRELIDKWASRQNFQVTVVRRPDHNGFKAGNLNYVIEKFVNEEFIVVCDADEILPTDFVERLLIYFCDEDVAFVQAAHEARSFAQTRFANLLGPSVDIFYKHCLPLRNQWGFVSCFGHGMIIKRSIWEAIGGFPEIVSEDLGFASRALAAGFRGLYVEDVVAEEAFPSTYTSFLKKHCKVISGTIEYFRKEYPLLVRSSNATWTEKVDILLTFSSCYIGIIAMINLCGGLTMLYIYKLQGYDRLDLWLLLIYLIGPFTPIVPLAINLIKRPSRYVHFICTAALAYASLFPVLAFKGLVQLLKIRKPSFEPTGRISRQKQFTWEHFLTQFTGLLILAIVFVLRSPAFIPTIGIALMFMLAPLMCFTERTGKLGLLARNCSFVPFAVMIVLMFSWR